MSKTKIDIDFLEASIEESHPILVKPKVAQMIGLNEAIVLQQIIYWINSPSGVEIDDVKWVYNTIDQWRNQFPFWSARTIRRALDSLKEMGLIDAQKLSNNKFDNTLYYRPIFGKYSGKSNGTNCPHLNMTNCPHHYTENTKTNSTAEQAKQIIDYLNVKAGTAYRHAQSHLRLITARINDGATVDEMKRVIDQKCEDWLSDNRMKTYLRPSTLFNATNYENYAGSISAEQSNAEPTEFMMGL